MRSNSLLIAPRLICSLFRYDSTASISLHPLPWTDLNDLISDNSASSVLVTEKKITLRLGSVSRIERFLLTRFEHVQVILLPLLITACRVLRCRMECFDEASRVLFPIPVWLFSNRNFLSERLLSNPHLCQTTVLIAVNEALTDRWRSSLTKVCSLATANSGVSPPRRFVHDEILASSTCLPFLINL